MSSNVDTRLVSRWADSQRAQRKARIRLANSSLPLERFEGWALDMIVDAITPAAARTARLIPAGFALDPAPSEPLAPD